MKTLIVLTIALMSFNSFAIESAKSCGFEEKIFTAKHTKEGESFVGAIAFEKAKEKAYDEGFLCNARYRYSLKTSIFNSNKFTSTVEATCWREIFDCPEK